MVYPLGVLKHLMGKSLRLLACRFHFLKVISEVESYHSNASSHAYLIRVMTWVNVRGGCYRVVSEDGLTIGLNGRNLDCHECM